ncbi:MAG: type II toxin-antitoxin system RatA family toxin [Gammaproteobacteria bacterium]|nr:type II toxin-antitoxin system RatA family toxin [Gammaproteobacteria bacterium]MCP4091185.1 type II toxin-antitoxin system RatA family toxin [Gammaproteobacteria bacterium]MCP4277794.1 type II toxin-antitoxin system RatA family toxin [Gammaproteobacteria bacterium]MCP4831650.1 type II toxin-antitoxin system RatA family toxin [Gammaproteobacteria bacterium]MCP4929324.1 type II toxin-antitoxin system RatA family toxin [Gammaproteobacteria bacterium]
MRVVDRNAMVPYSAEQMYALVDDVDAYSDFLPWCTASVLQSRDTEEFVASLTIGYGALNSAFTTRNLLHPPSSMTMQLQDGPFRFLEGLWEFEQLGDSGCEVRLRVEFEFSSTMQDMLFGKTFESICNELIDAFVKRAHVLYSVP